MGYGFKAAAGGGSNLNFSVKTYASEETLLSAAPKENTIGVVTDTAVPKWGFYAAKPEAPEEGELCFTVATESAGSFNALKKNTLMVYPVACKQYISGAWVNRKAYIYIDGTWTQFSSDIFYIFKSGSADNLPLTTGKQANGAVSIYDDRISLYYSGEAYCITWVYTDDPIDVSNYSTLNVEAKVSGIGPYVPNDNNGKFGLSDAASTSTTGGSWIASAGFDKENVQKVYQLDISSISGEARFRIYGCTQGSVYNIWLS